MKQKTRKPSSPRSRDTARKKPVEVAVEIVDDLEQGVLGATFKRNDVPCPKCGSTGGSDVEPTHPADDGRHRGRTCNECKYFWRTFEEYPKYDGPPFARREDPEGLIERDCQCPRCHSREGSKIIKSYPTNFGRGRRRVGYCCGYFFETFESYPKHEDPNKVNVGIRGR